MNTARYALAVFLTFVAATSSNAATIFSESFADVASLSGAGWVLANNSAPVGTTGWFQGDELIFPSHSGAGDEYVAANFLNASFGGDISNWLITPEMSIANGDTLFFFTRAAGGSGFADRLEVRLSASGASADVGSTAASVGDFTALLVTVNPALLPDGYPDDWTLFSAVVSGLSGPTTGRYAFRYFVPDTFVNGDYVGIDTFSIDRSAVPEPAVTSLLVLGAALLSCSRRRASKS